MRTLVITNQMGNVGKSAIATLLAHYLVRRGLCVLAIDLDHQAAFASALLRSGRAVPADITSCRPFADPAAAVPDGKLVVVSPSNGLLTLQEDAENHSPVTKNLQRFQRRVDAQFDVCVIDTPSTPDIRVIAALASAHRVLCPVRFDQSALEGVYKLLYHQHAGVWKIQRLLNPALKLIGILPNLVENTLYQQANANRLMSEYLRIFIPRKGQ